jgi:hypothetical protein
MTFYIIYTPNSTQYLIHFIPSLLEHTAYHFCLVPNGCSSKERAILKKLSETNERLSYYCFPANQMQIHGKVLTHLQAKCLDEYFCFMDSDIFATAMFSDLKQILEKENLTGLFGGMPLWVKESEHLFKPSFKGMLGTFNKMEDGSCIGSTYFSLYKNEDLNQIIQHYGVCFDEISRNNLPTDIQQELHRLGYYQNSFDTGKVIGLFLNKHNFHLKNIEIPELCHIGGTSYETTNRTQQHTSKKQQLKKRLLKSPLKTVLLRYFEDRKERILKARYKDAPVEEYQINYNQRGLHRNYTRQHFLKLFLALRNNEPLPISPIFKNVEITQKVAQAHKSYIQNFKKYYN